jgi:hypothetical protein
LGYLVIYHTNGTNWDIGDVEQSVKESSNDFGFYGTIDANVELTVDNTNGTNWDIGDVEQSVKESSNDFGFYGTIEANVELTVSRNYCAANCKKLRSKCDTSEHQIYTRISLTNKVLLYIIENAPTKSGQYEEKKQLLEKEYINTIIDDLLEVFLHS